MKLISLVLAISSCFATAATEPTRQVTYKTIDKLELKLHIFEPEKHQKTDKKPAIVFFFGGGWQSGTPKQFYSQSDLLAQQGIISFCAEYRVKSRNKTTPFEAVEDAKSAIRWVRKHASELGIDPDRIIASGGSAGGHLAACTDLINGYEQKDENHKISSKPNATILYNPVLDTTNKGFGTKAVGIERKTAISPIHHIRKNLAPTLLLHGTADKTVPFENAERYAKLMQKAGNHCTLISAKDKGHGFFNSKMFRPKLKNNHNFDKSMQDTISFLIELRYINH